MPRAVDSVLLLTQGNYYAAEAACYRPGALRVTGTDVPGAGHWLLEERPEQVRDQLDRFLA